MNREYKEYNDWKDHVKTDFTVNDKLSEDLDKTIDDWIADGYIEMDPKDIIDELDPRGNYKVRYINNDMMARSGGILTSVVNENGKQFIRIKNHVANVSWSVQIGNLYKIYYKHVSPKIKKVKEAVIKKPSYTDEQMEIAILEAIEQTGSQSADKNYKYIKEHMMIDITRQFVRDYFANLD